MVATQLIQGRRGAYKILSDVWCSDLTVYSLGMAVDSTVLVLVRQLMVKVSGKAALAKAVLDDFSVTTRMDHPNLLRVVDSGKTLDSYFAVYELLLGDGLGCFIQASADADKDPLDPVLVLDIIANICSGMDNVYSTLKKLPGDIQLRPNLYPGNVVIGYDGSVKLNIFGGLPNSSAELRDDVNNSLPYASPEQCAEGKTDERSGVFSVGVILWELLAKRPLFRRVSQKATKKAILSGALPSLASIVQVPPQIEMIAVRALQLQADARFQTPKQFEQAIREYLETCQGYVPGQASLFVQAVFSENQKKKELLINSALRHQEVDAQLLLPDMEISLAWPVRPSSHSSEEKPASVLPPKPLAPSSQTSQSNPVSLEVAGQGLTSGFRKGSRLFLSLLLISIALGLVWLLWPSFAEKELAPKQPSPPVAEAALSIDSNPENCPVWLNGSQLEGNTPIKHNGLPVGVEQTVELHCPGYKVDQVRFVAQQHENVIIAFNPEPTALGILDLRTQPSVDVYYKNRKLGATPIDGVFLPVGQQQLRLVKSPSGESVVITVPILAGKTTRLKKDMRK